MASGALCSDHVNYLILRYLQEAGHENAATAFWRDWHRLPEFKDPEQYPFARTVQRGELINVIQDGLHHDELIARVKKNERRFLFTQVVTREGAVGRGSVVENGVVGARSAEGSRPGSSGKRKEGRVVGRRVQEEFPTPAPKRIRRSDGSEGVHLNGDAMDIDAESGSPDGDVDDAELASPGEGEEVEIVEVPERYDSMDAAVQAAPEAGPPTKTMYWKIDKPDAIVSHSAFSPAIKSETDSTHTLLTIGDSLCRFYQVPDEIQDSKKILSIDDPTMPPNCIVTAAAWSPDGSTAACAIDSYREVAGGKQEPRQTLLTHSHKTGTSSHYIYPPLIESGAVALSLRYRSKLLVVRTNGKRGLVLIYETDSDRSDPLAWKIFEHPVWDAAWISDDEFVLCGDGGVLECHRVLTSISIPSTRTTETIVSHGLEKQDWLPPLSSTWDKVRYDEAAQVIAVASITDQQLAMCIKRSSIRESHWASVDLPGGLTALAFQVERSTDHLPLLAAAFEDGSCTLYTHQQNSSTSTLASIDELIIIHVSSGPALALAWSPNGAHLAVGGTELINIWETKALVQRNAETKRVEQKPSAQLRPVITWSPDPAATGPRNGEHEARREVSEPSLSWSSDGESLAFAVEKQVAVIRFEKPLMKSGLHADEAEVNGVES